MGRCLGIDYGQRRIGLAIGDEEGIIAFPLGVIQNSGKQSVIKEIIRIIAEKTVDKIIVGLPLNMDGSKGPAVEGVEQFVNLLKAHVSLPIDVWDERLSTRMAEQAMIAGGLSRRRRRESIDQSTAQIILQSYLDAHDKQSLPE